MSIPIINFFKADTCGDSCEFRYNCCSALLGHKQRGYHDRSEDVWCGYEIRKMYELWGEVKWTDLWWVVGREEAEQQQQHQTTEWRQPLRVDTDVGDDKDDEADTNTEVNRPTTSAWLCIHGLSLAVWAEWMNEWMSLLWHLTNRRWNYNECIQNVIVCIIKITVCNMI